MAGFEGKVALVTGSGGGIGRAIAAAFAAEGARVLVADVDPAGGAETVAAIVAAGGTALYRHCDVADEGSVAAMVAATVEAFGRLDCAVNNAAIDPEIAPEPDWDIATLDRILALNLRGVALCLKAQIAAMRTTGGGAIVNIASYAGIAGVANKPFYTAAKHGVVGLTRSAGLDQAKHNIRINAICPGFTVTPMAMANTDATPGAFDAVIARNPTRRVGLPADMAAATLFLCSEGAAFIVGQALSIDGGISV